MSQTLAIDELASAITEQLTRKLPIDIDLWAPEQCAEYFKVSRRQFTERYAAQPDFPKGIRLPSEGGRGSIRWKAMDIIKWANALPKA